MKREITGKTLLDVIISITGWSRSHAKRVIKQGGVRIGVRK